jgi:hypothetical protein
MSPFAKTEIDSPRKKQKISSQSISPQNRNIFPAKITKGNYLPAKILHARCLPMKTESDSPQKFHKNQLPAIIQKISAQSVSPQKRKYTPRKNYQRKVSPCKNILRKVSPRENGK